VNVLFPSPTSNHGSAALARDQTVPIPESGPFVFEEEARGETLLIIWSAAPQPRLDAMQKWANARDLGEIGDAGDLDALDTFLRAHASPRPDAEVDREAGVTTLRAPANVFVQSITLGR
jgi:hypothetical protein